MPCVRRYWCCNAFVLACHISFNHFVFALFYAGGKNIWKADGVITGFKISINMAYVSGVNVRASLMDVIAAKFYEPFKSHLPSYVLRSDG